MCPLETDNLIEATVGAHEDSSKSEDLTEIKSKTAPQHPEQKILQDLCSDIEQDSSAWKYGLPPSSKIPTVWNR